MTPATVRRLALALAVAYATLGALEVVLKVWEDSAFATILFFGGTLLGGSGVIALGLFAHVATTTRRVLVMLGAAVGLLASAWTLVVPALALVVIFASARRPAPPDPEQPAAETGG